MSDNTGHRQRVKDRFLQEGLEHFHEIHVLELLLFYCFPRIDTKPLARRLIDHFGSLAQVLEAPPLELERVAGIGRNASTFLSLVNQVGRYHQASHAANIRILDTTDKYGTYLKSHFFGVRNEMVYLLCLDGRCRLITCVLLSEGSVNSASISPRRIIEIAISVNASSVILAHNHTSGIVVPSKEDIATTARIDQGLRSVEVPLVDHVIVAGNDYLSLVQSGYYIPESVRLLF